MCVGCGRGARSAQHPTKRNETQKTCITLSDLNINVNERRKQKKHQQINRQYYLVNVDVDFS